MGVAAFVMWYRYQYYVGMTAPNTIVVNPTTHTHTGHKTGWPKPGARIEPTTYDWIKRYATEVHLSFNDVLNLLLREAITHRDKEATPA